MKQETIERLMPLVNTVISRAKPHQDLVEDCRQAGVLAIYDAVASWDSQKGISLPSWSWFYIVKAVYKEANFFNDIPGKIDAFSAEISEDEEFRVVDEEYIEAEIGVISALLPDLPDRQQDVLILYAEGKTFGEIAEDMGISRQAAHRLYKRAVTAVSRILDNS